MDQIDQKDNVVNNCEPILPPLNRNHKTPNPNDNVHDDVCDWDVCDSDYQQQVNPKRESQGNQWRELDQEIHEQAPNQKYDVSCGSE